ncbi:hypothetical protein [Streptomyces sp. NPDC059874]|uniref:hypothetical protein n=1 Tax=Streptomyces sp. NPDC059874 TaxID=3346983 RepID=UPI003659EB9C
MRLTDTDEFQWIARTVACEGAGKRAVVREAEAMRIPPGCVAVDCPPTELRVGDQVLAGGRLVVIADLRYRFGAPCATILCSGAVCVAERTICVYRPHTVR